METGQIPQRSRPGEERMEEEMEEEEAKNETKEYKSKHLMP